MKRLFGIVFVALLVLPVRAVKVKEDETVRVDFVELRANAEFTKEFRHGLSLSLGEEIRGRVFETDEKAYFRGSYTTLSFGYEPIQYLKLDLGYTLRLLGYKGWDDPNEFVRHRAYLSVIGKYKYGNWRFSFRERLVLNARTDSVNRYEKNPLALELWHRVHVGYYIPGRPVQVFGNVEVTNTLNRPTQYLNYYIEDEHFGQYVNGVKCEFGTKWRIDKRNWLRLSYRFEYQYHRDLNITARKGNIELTRIHGCGHVITLAYDLNW